MIEIRKASTTLFGGIKIIQPVVTQRCLQSYRVLFVRVLRIREFLLVFLIELKKAQRVQYSTRLNFRVSIVQRITAWRFVLNVPGFIPGYDMSSKFVDFINRRFSWRSLNWQFTASHLSTGGSTPRARFSSNSFTSSSEMLAGQPYAAATAASRFAWASASHCGRVL